MFDDLVRRYRAGDRLALARLLTLAARGERLSEMRSAVGRRSSESRTIAVTGAGGVGKSTLVGRLIGEVRRHGRRVAVLACDPRSPVTGGALLGDRFRMPAAPDDGVYIRSLTAGAGAIARHMEVMTRLLHEFGFDVVLIETVGAGQGDTSFGGAADAVMLVLQPLTGDDVQWDKAGVFEVADVIAINKGDLPGADQTEAQVRASLGLSPGRDVPVLRVSARTGEGVPALWERLSAIPLRPAGAAVHELVRAGCDELAAWLARLSAADLAVEAGVADRWRDGTLSTAAALRALLARFEASNAGRG